MSAVGRYYSQSSDHNFCTKHKEDPGDEDELWDRAENNHHVGQETWPLRSDMCRIGGLNCHDVITMRQSQSQLQFMYHSCEAVMVYFVQWPEPTESENVVYIIIEFTSPLRPDSTQAA